MATLQFQLNKSNLSEKLNPNTESLHQDIPPFWVLHIVQMERSTLQ